MVSGLKQFCLLLHFRVILDSPVAVRETIAHYLTAIPYRGFRIRTAQRVDEADTPEPLIFSEHIKAVERPALLTSTLYTASFPFSRSVNLWASGETGLLTEE